MLPWYNTHSVTKFDAFCLHLSQTILRLLKPCCLSDFKFLWKKKPPLMRQFFRSGEIDGREKLTQWTFAHLAQKMHALPYNNLPVRCQLTDTFMVKSLFIIWPKYQRILIRDNFPPYLSSASARPASLRKRALWFAGRLTKYMLRQQRASVFACQSWDLC